jgi:hypothetical protein
MNSIFAWSALLVMGATFGCSSSSSNATSCPNSGASCPNGEAIQACMTKSSDGSCSSIYYMVGSQTFNCKSCSAADRQTCASQAAMSCTGGGTDSGSGGGDASTD